MGNPKFKIVGELATLNLTMALPNSRKLSSDKTQKISCQNINLKLLKKMNLQYYQMLKDNRHKRTLLKNEFDFLPEIGS